MASKRTLSLIAATILGACAFVQTAMALDMKAASRFAGLDQTFKKLEDSGAPAADAAKWREIRTAYDRIRNKLDSLNEMSEMESLRLQMAMDRLSKLMSAMSNILKKESETSNSIIQNMK